jgi:hypothetical protein
VSAPSRFALALFLLVSPLGDAFAFDSVATDVSQALVPFASDEGLERLSRSDAKVDFPELANQFEAEYNGAFCGPASAAIILNAVWGRNDHLPRDRGRFHPEDGKYAPPGMDGSIPRFTQDNVFDKSPKTRAQVFGEPVTINGKVVQDFGFQLRELDGLLRANGAATRLVIVDDIKPEQDIRADLIETLKHRGDYVIVGYQRKAVGQEGPAHISPLGAYDAQSDSFLVLDVNPTRAPWVWMPAATLVKGMRTFDTVENRGYIVVSKGQ